jgi:nucleotide-binding universal stress UspA family protein
MGHGDVFTVGYDGSPSARRALNWAAAEAARRGGMVRLVACFTPPVSAEPWYVPAAVDIDRVRDDTVRHLHAAVASSEQRHPSVQFETEARVGPAAAELVDAARDSTLLVVGTRGHGSADPWRIGSVSQSVARHAPCPVAVVPEVESRPARDRVVVGIDGSISAAAALRWACREADVRDAELRIVHAWEYPYATELGTPQARDLTAVDAALLLEDSVRVARGHSNGAAEGRLVQGRTAAELVEEARDADLLVVGSRGRGAVRSLLFGSVSHEVSARASSPVVIVRGESDDADL